jgi:uncharacterized membrane protein
MAGEVAVLAVILVARLVFRLLQAVLDLLSFAGHPDTKE